MLTLRTPLRMPSLDLLDRHAVGLLHLAAVLADDSQPLLRHARLEPCITRCVFGNARVDLLDAVDREDVAGRLAA